MKRPTNLNYIINNPLGISIDPVESDNMTNAVLMKHLVGTLVRYANGGQFLPYLVDNFTSTDDGRRWKFILRSDLKCQSGQKITAQGYIDGLMILFRLYLKQGHLPVFSDLNGWSDFEKGHDLKGLIAKSEKEIEFTFQKAVGPGFLEYLSMPYYGYFCGSNFENKKWKSHLSIVSSGPYQLEKAVTNPTEVNLVLRDHWPMSPTTAPERIFFSTNINSDSWTKKNTVLQSNLGWHDSVPAGHRHILGPPDVIRSIIMDPMGPSAFFKDIQVRRLFYKKILDLKLTADFQSKTATLADAFYPGSKPKIYESELRKVMPKGILKVFLPKSKNEDTIFAISLLKQALTELGWKYELFVSGETAGLTSSDYQSKTKFDIRVSSVIAGSVVEPWVVEMMFCSNLGVSYPDPSKKICKYINMLKFQSDFSFSEVGATISNLVAEDAAVIPIYHGRNSWYFTHDLDVSKISGDLIIPSFEDIGLKE